MVVAAFVVILLALATGSAFALGPHSHWVLLIEQEDGSGQAGTFNDEAACKTAAAYVDAELSQITLRSECIEIPLGVKIERELEGEKS
jgi:hypothetical protein